MSASPPFPRRRCVGGEEEEGEEEGGEDVGDGLGAELRGDAVRRDAPPGGGDGRVEHVLGAVRQVAVRGGGRRAEGALEGAGGRGRGGQRDVRLRERRGLRSLQRHARECHRGPGGAPRRGAQGLRVELRQEDRRHLRRSEGDAMARRQAPARRRRLGPANPRRRLRLHELAPRRPPLRTRRHPKTAGPLARGTPSRRRRPGGQSSPPQGGRRQVQ
mmetsp:Transcript_10298/g.34029  ORF Transcript_10298/g.34029 Transcript_10298/m.34029 type:complete len:216 (-) Transcript_10298:186-833(-)